LGESGAAGEKIWGSQMTEMQGESKTDEEAKNRKEQWIRKADTVWRCKGTGPAREGPGTRQNTEKKKCKELKGEVKQHCARGSERADSRLHLEEEIVSG